MDTIHSSTLNIHFLHQHYEDFNHACNFQMSHILRLKETRIHYASIDLHKFINSSKYLYMSIHDGHELIMTYDILHMCLDFFNAITYYNSKCVATTFNTSPWKITYCICV